MIALLWLACWPGPPPLCGDCADFDDGDGDGFVPADGDCNDADPAVHPAAQELCNRMDDDCDGAIDEDALDAPTGYRDLDEDGFGSGDPQTACPTEERLVDNNDDCNDADATVHPGKQEVCNDGLDNDCDGTPGTCARLGRRSLVEADARIVSAYGGDLAGTSVASLPPNEQVQGRDGLVVGLPGASLGFGGIARIFSPELLGDTAFDDVVDAFVLSGLFLARTGGQVATSPSGVAIREFDILDQTAAVHLLPPSHPSIGHPIRDAAIMTVESFDLGFRLALATDGGLLLSAMDPGVSAWWVPEPVNGRFHVSSVGIPIYGPNASAVALEDFDGDGHVDLAVSNEDAAFASNSHAGRVWVFFGPVTRARETSSADRTYEGVQQSAFAGGALGVLPDLDANGRPELAVGAPSGRAAWVLDATTSSGALDDRAWLRVDGPPGSQLGASFAAPDLDHDGALDIAIGAPQDGEVAPNAGAVYIFRGPLNPGVRTTDSAELLLRGASTLHEAGRSLTWADFDGDGLDDLVIGVPGESSVAVGGGGIYIWRGQGL